MESRSLDMHRSYREAQFKFDNFVLVIILAVCAYLGQSNPYAKIGMNPETMYFLSLVTLVGAAYFGFRRIEYTIEIYKHNSLQLHVAEVEEQSRVAKTKDLLVIEKAIIKFKEKTQQFYNRRNRLMLLGICLYVTAKYWEVYLPVVTNIG